MPEVIVQPGQTLLDIAIQAGGDEEMVAELAIVNGIEVTKELTPGMVLQLIAPINKRIARLFREGPYYPATGYSGELEGIDYWGIEYDFIVT